MRSLVVVEESDVSEDVSVFALAHMSLFERGNLHSMTETSFFQNEKMTKVHFSPIIPVTKKDCLNGTQ